MNIKKILTLAIAENAKAVVSEIMNTLMAEFIEGEIDESGNIFNQFFHILPKDMKIETLRNCPFESTANRLASNYGLPPFWEKVTDYEWKYIGPGKNPYDKV